MADELNLHNHGRHTGAEGREAGCAQRSDQLGGLLARWQDDRFGVLGQDPQSLGRR